MRYPHICGTVDAVQRQPTLIPLSTGIGCPDFLRSFEDMPPPPTTTNLEYPYAHSGVAVGFFAPCAQPRCRGPPHVSEICSQPNFRIRRNHIWVLIMQKTFQQDVINRKVIKNTGQLPMYLIENHHEGIVSREKYNAVQAEMARRKAAKSPSKRASTGLAAYTSRYALSDRLVCGECGTLYRRCTWTRPDGKRVVLRCVSRLDYGKKYCHNSPTLDEAPLQQAILAALNTAMADKNSLIRQITDAMETEIIPFPGGTMSLGDIERRLRELEQQFHTLLEKATDDPAAYGGQFKEILDEQTFLKEKRSVILANNNEQAKANQRIMDAAQTLENASPYITEWDESAVRQLVETVKILSKDEVAVTLKGGIEICQKIMY